MYKIPGKIIAYNIQFRLKYLNPFPPRAFFNHVMLPLPFLIKFSRF